MWEMTDFTSSCRASSASLSSSAALRASECEACRVSHHTPKKATNATPNPKATTPPKRLEGVPVVVEEEEVEVPVGVYT